MASSYLEKVFVANRLHELLSKLWIPFPLSWNHRVSKWTFKESLVYPYSCSTVLFKLGIDLCSTTAFVYGVKNPGTLSKVHMVTLFLDIFGMLLFILIDYLTVGNGRELAVSANWANQKEQWLRRFGMLITW